MLTETIRIKGLRGVGDLTLTLRPEQRVYTFIGTNGVGKTKMLEALFQYFFFTYDEVHDSDSIGVSDQAIVFDELTTESKNSLQTICRPKSLTGMTPPKRLSENLKTHSHPVVYVGSQTRGYIKHEESKITPLGQAEKRKHQYIKDTIKAMENNFSSLNMSSNVEDWFVKAAQSSNPYQKQEDNREVEITTLLTLMHRLDPRIDAEHMKIGGDDRVFLKIDGKETELAHLSTGFASILKIMQTIISGYGYFTNAQNLAETPGIVLIDEIESHLHLSWQIKIIPLLKELFPKTTFYITTHSPLVLALLNEGEAYRLVRDDDELIRSEPIQSPQSSTLVDILNEAFGLNLNQQKLAYINANEQADAKQKLLELLNASEV